MTFAGQKSIIINHSSTDYSRFVRDPTPENLRNNRPTRIFRITKMQPICQFHGPSLVMQLIDKYPVFREHTVGGDTSDAVRSIISSVHGLDIAWAGAYRSEVGGGCVWRTRRGIGGCKALIESLDKEIRSRGCDMPEEVPERQPTWRRSTWP